MNAYLHKLFFDGHGIFAVKAAVCGYAHVEALNMRDPLEMASSRKALLGYRAIAPDHQRDPCPWEAVLLIAKHLLELKTETDTVAAHACLIAFECYTRPSELLAVRPCDIVVLREKAVHRYPMISMRLAPSSDELAGGAKATKAGEFDDTVVLGDAVSSKFGRAWIADLTAALAKRRAGLQQLLPITLGQWEASFRRAVSDLRLDSLRASPHTLRHGAASTDYALKARDLLEIQRRGRWKAVASVRRYEKSGRLAAQVALLSPQQLRQARALATSLPKTLKVSR